MITAKNATAENNSGLGVNRFNLVMTPEVFKVFYSSLYEDKTLAVLRELVSNGADGLKAAGITDVPVTIHLPTPLLPELVITDTGVGMSLEDIQNTYTVYGKSTKGASNDEIGGFGYGAKSPFAISQSFTVETTKHGITTTFVNYIDEDGPNYAVTSSEHTGKPSGTSVRVPVADTDLQAQLAEKATGKLFVLWEVPPVIRNTKTNVIPTEVLDRSELFIALPHSRYGDSSIQTVGCGPFVYQIPINMLSKLREHSAYKIVNSIAASSRYLYQHTQQVNIVPLFKVGELELSPSRERIEDTPENLTAITARMTELAESWSMSLESKETEIGKATSLVQRFGVRMSDLVGPYQQDHVIAFNDVDQVIKELLPTGWKPTPTNIAAALHRYGSLTFTGNYRDLADVPDYLQRAFVSVRDIGVQRVYRDVTTYDQYGVHTPKSILESVVGTVSTMQEYVAREVFNTLSVTQKIARTYRKVRGFGTATQIIVVPTKTKAKVSRCYNGALLSNHTSLTVFTDEVKKTAETLRKTGELLGLTLTFTYEAEITALTKTLPKVVRTTTTAGKVKVKTNRRIGQSCSGVRGDLNFVLEDEVAPLLTGNPVLVFVTSDSVAREFSGIDSTLSQVFAAVDATILFVSTRDYREKKYIATLVDDSEKLPNVTVVKDGRLHFLNRHLATFLAAQTHCEEYWEAAIASRLLDKVTFDQLYPQNAVQHNSSYYNYRYNDFGSYLAKTPNCTVTLRCQWLGYTSLSDIKLLSDVMDATSIQFVKTAISGYAKTLYTF